MSLNTRTLSTLPSVDTLLRKTERIRYDIIGINETRTPTTTTCTTPEGHLLVRGARDPTSLAGGVGFLIHNSFLKNVVSTEIIGPRLGIAVIRISKRRLLSVYSVYAPTQAHSEDDIEDFYSDLEALLRSDKNKYKIIVGDFNACVGPRQGDERLIGPNSADSRDEAGERLAEFAAAQQLYVANGFFQKQTDKRWTHVNPKGTHKREIDYILTNNLSIITDVAVVGTDFPSDHRPLRANILIGRHHMIWRKKLGPRRAYDYKGSGAAISRNLPVFDETNLQEDYGKLVAHIQAAIKENYIPLPTHKELRISPATQKLLKELREKKLRGEDHAELAKEVRICLRRDHEDFATGKLLRAAERRQSLKTARRTINLLRELPGQIKKTDGTMASTEGDKVEAVKQFYGNLFSTRDTTPPAALPPSNPLPPITYLEVKKAIQSSPSGKAAGEDMIPIEVLKEAGPPLLFSLATRFTAYLRHSWTPAEWKTSRTTLIFKKGSAEDLENYRPIAILPTLYKVFMKCLVGRLRTPLEDQQPVEQAGFRTGFSTMDHIQAVYRLAELTREFQIPLVFVFVDFRKAFDSAEIGPLLNSLIQQSIEPGYVSVIAEIYSAMTTKIKLLGDDVEVPITRGVRQGDPLSPAIFSAALEQAMRSKNFKRMSPFLAGKTILPLRFADDIVIVSYTPRIAEYHLSQLDAAVKPFGLEISTSKTVVMRNRFTSKDPVHLNGQPLPEKDSFVYLGREINMQGELRPEISRRIRAGWAAYQNIEPVLKTSKDTRLKANLFNTTVLPALTYASETWALNEADERRLRVTQANMERRMLGLTVTQQRQQGLHNSDIRTMTQFNDVVIHADSLKHQWAGHLVRRDDGRWSTRLTLWDPKADGYHRPPGRPPTRWSKSILFRYTQSMGASAPPWFQTARNRDQWKQLWDSQQRNRP